MQIVRSLILWIASFYFFLWFFFFLWSHLWLPILAIVYQFILILYCVMNYSSSWIMLVLVVCYIFQVSLLIYIWNHYYLMIVTIYFILYILNHYSLMIIITYLYTSYNYILVWNHYHKVILTINIFANLTYVFYSCTMLSINLDNSIKLKRISITYLYVLAISNITEA